MKLFIITGTCGSRKSTMKDELAVRLDPSVTGTVLLTTLLMPFV